MSAVPQVNENTWIKLASGIDAYVFKVVSKQELTIGYYQNNLKAIKENVVWANGNWEFVIEGPNGTYLRGPEESLVKHGPRY